MENINYFKGRKNRIGWFVSRYKKVYLVVMAVWLPFIVLMSVITLVEWQKVASADYNIAHSFMRVHKNY